jgi:hypothetical protein
LLTPGLFSTLEDLATLLREMGRRPEFHFPIVAAQRQFRERYYGLLSAAMLEDLYFDALAHFISTHRPDLQLRRPPRGEKGWDYSLNGLNVSHKVSKGGPQEIAVLWDATRTDLTTYNYGSSISLATSSYKPVSIRVEVDKGPPLSGRAISAGSKTKKDDVLLLVNWPESNISEILHRWNFSGSADLCETVNFKSVWSEVARVLATGIPANHLELVLVNDKHQQLFGVTKVHLSHPCRPGLYLIPQSSLIQVPVVTNNRAVLIERELVAAFMSSSVKAGLFVPMSIWFTAYSGDRPPDLYLAQRSSFDLVFSYSPPQVSK